MGKIIKLGYLVFVTSFISSIPAMAYSPFLDQSYDMYSVRNKCEMCHSGMKLNAFGKDFEIKWKEQNKNIVKAFLALENKDSDNDGFLNVYEIKAMSLPGDKVSVPNVKISFNTPDIFRKIK